MSVGIFVRMYSVTQASGWPASVEELSAALRPQAQGPLWVGVVQSCLQNGGLSVGAVLGMSAQPGPTVGLNSLSTRAVGHPSKIKMPGRKGRWRQVRTIMAGWITQHGIQWDRFSSHSRSRSRFREGFCCSHRPV